jgi:hypothetical protein
MLKALLIGSLILLNASPAFSAVTNQGEIEARKGCQPKRDKNGCADKGAPIAFGGVPNIPWCRTGQKPTPKKPCRVPGLGSGGLHVLMFPPNAPICKPGQTPGKDWCRVKLAKKLPYVGLPVNRIRGAEEPNKPKEPNRGNGRRDFRANEVFQPQNNRQPKTVNGADFHPGNVGFPQNSQHTGTR